MVGTRSTANQGRVAGIRKTHNVAWEEQGEFCSASIQHL